LDLLARHREGIDRLLGIGVVDRHEVGSAVLRTSEVRIALTGQHLVAFDGAEVAYPHCRSSVRFAIPAAWSLHRSVRPSSVSAGATGEAPILRQFRCNRACILD